MTHCMPICRLNGKLVLLHSFDLVTFVTPRFFGWTALARFDALGRQYFVRPT